MSSNPQYPPQGGRGGVGGRGPQGGRGAGYFSGRGGAPPNRMGAWQPTAPTSVQQAAGFPPNVPQQPQQQQPQQPHPQQPHPQQQPQQQGQLPRGPHPYPQQPMPGMAPPYYNPYAQPGPYNPRSSWQPTYPQAGMRGAVFYPAAPQQPPSMPRAAAAQAPPVPARPKKPLVITDKQGNVIDLSGAAPKKPASSLQAAASAGASNSDTTPAPAASSNAGEKMRQAILEKLEAENKAKKGDQDASRAEDEAKAKAAEEEKRKAEDEKEAKRKLEEEAKKQKEEEEVAAKKKKEEEEEEEAKQQSTPFKKSSLADMLARSTGSAPPGFETSKSDRIVFNKEALLRFKDVDVCRKRPEGLAEMSITKGPSRRNSSTNRRDGGGGGGNWERGQNRRQNSSTGGGGSGGGGGGAQWERGQAPPKNQKRNSQRRGPGGPPFYDGPVTPLVKSENHWKPKKNTSALVVAEKKVKSILNKMTKEKFDRLSQQMMEIPITTYETLNMMIDNVYDKAIDEPSFGDIYADLCVQLSQSVQVVKLVHIIESDEQPPTEDGQSAAPDAEGTHHTVYRWSNDVGANDSEIVGPLPSEDACFEAALDEEEREPVSRGEMELELVSMCIRRGIFIKIMKKKDASEDEGGVYYTVYFPLSEAEELGQQMSEIFLSQIECESDAAKKNSFKRSLLNKCEEEFNKQDIYVDWKAEKKAYEETKSSLKEAERAEKEEELDFRRIRIKKQMLGNVKFIGQLYKKRLLKEKIMRYCIASLLKLEELPKTKEEVKSKNPEYKDSGDIDMDEEDHEAICNMFTTIGSTIDTPAAAHFMDVCFTKIGDLSVNADIPTRSRFMYKDLLELRGNNWVPRRKEEKAKTLEEIRKDVEREERRQAQLSQQQQQQQQQRGPSRDYSSRSMTRGQDYRGGARQPVGNRPRQPKPNTEPDEDGFTTVTTGSKSGSQRQLGKPQQQRSAPVATQQAFAALAEEQLSTKPKAEPLSKEALERRIKSMRSDFMSDGGNVDELLLSMEELSATPNAGMELISNSADRIMDCKEDERKAIYRIITVLVEKKKITDQEVRDGLMDAIEFIDSMVMDSPRAFEYLGTLIGEMLRLKVVDVKWLCAQCEKTKVDPHTKAPEKLIKHSFEALKSSGGDASPAVDTAALTSLLGEDVWNAIAQEVI